MNHKTEIRESEAARLEVPAGHPGDDPPTYGDEGGGTLYPEHSLNQPPRSRWKIFFRRLLGLP
jgi:hypothetical protein